MLLEAPVMLKELTKEGLMAARGSAIKAWRGASIEARAEDDWAVITSLVMTDPGEELRGMQPSCGLSPDTRLVPEHLRRTSRQSWL